MRIILFALGICAAMALATRVEAQNYPWCAYYDDGGVGGTNCGFVSFEQCMTTVRGIGGFCNVNTQYQPPLVSHPANRPRHRF